MYELYRGARPASALLTKRRMLNCILKTAGDQWRFGGLESCGLIFLSCIDYNLWTDLFGGPAENCNSPACMHELSELD